MSLNINKSLFFLSIVPLFLFNNAYATSDWKQYRFDESGFSISLPSKPKSQIQPLSSTEGQLRIYQSDVETYPPAKYTIFSGLPSEKGYYEQDSMNAFLEGSVKGIMQATKNSQLQYKKRIKYNGFPAIEYKFSYLIENFAMIAHGIVFMIDGGHMRLSMMHISDDVNSEKNFKKFTDSFKLIPISYVKSNSITTDPRGISFYSPDRWVKEPNENSYQIANYSNLTRNLQLLVAGDKTYACEQYKKELETVGGLLSSKTVNISGRNFTKLTTFADLPKYKVRLKTVHYCIDSQYGAVALTGTEEESMFSRWEKVFEGTATSIRIQ